MFEAIHEQLNTVQSAGDRATLERTIGELSRVESHAAERRLALTAAIDALDDGGIDGETATRVKTKRSSRASKKAAATATALARMPRTRAALARGEITEEHADVAATAAERVSPEQADLDLADDAARQPADMFARQARSWANARERDEEQKSRQLRQRAAREARMWTNAAGMECLYAEFDPIEGAPVKRSLQAEVDRLWRADGGRDGRPDDVRTPDQRRADALAGLLTRSDSADLSGASKRPHAKHTVVLRVDTDRCRGEDPSGIAEFVDGTPLPQSTLERIACGADFVGAVFGADGETLWQGRRTRTATEAQWTNLIARDGGCFCCDTEPAHCEAHHLIPWAPPTRGPTDIDKMVLVCRRTHRLVHEHGYRIERIDGRWQLRPPAAETGHVQAA